MKTLTILKRLSKECKTGIPVFFAIACLTSLFEVSEVSAAETSVQYTKGTDTLVVYNDVPGLAPSEFYNIRVRSAATNNEWVTCFASITRSLASSLLAQGIKPEKASQIEHYYLYLKDWSHTYANIEMSSGSRVEVEISSKNGFKIKGLDFTSAAAHPAHKAERPIVVDNKVLFKINDPALITIDINGQMDETNTGNGYSGLPVHTVSLYANPVIKKPVIGAAGVYLVNPGAAAPTKPAAYTTLYFAPGIHNVGRNFQVYSDRNYYIPGDAIVYGTINNLSSGGGTNVRIYGYGTLCGDFIKHPNHDPARGDRLRWKGIYAERCANFRIEGISISNPPYHTMNLRSKSAAKGSFCHWLKIVTWKGNGDGIGSADEVQNCFIRTQDDCTYVKGDNKGSVLWSDVNGAAFMLAGTPGGRPLVVEDCDIIYPRHCSTGWAGGRVFAKRVGQKTPNAKLDVLFKDIRITDKFQTLETFNLNNGQCSGITFKNITSVKTPSRGDNKIVDGWDNITFDNVVLGGKKIGSASDFGTFGPGVTNVKFICLAVTYKVSLSVNGGGARGTVSGDGTYSYGQTISISASAAAGYKFAGWVENNATVSLDPNYTFTVAADRQLAANFSEGTKASKTEKNTFKNPLPQNPASYQ